MKTKYTFEMLQEEALKYKTKKEFRKMNSKVFYSASKRKLINQICKHMPKHIDQSGENNPRFKWSNEKLQNEALKYKSRVEFEENNCGAYYAALKRKLLDTICFHMGKPKNKPWTNAELQEEALKYKSRGEFQKNSNGAYQAAHTRKILDQICLHMPEHVNISGENSSNFKWTLEKLQQEALKYKSRGEFQTNSRAYNTAISRRVLDQICSHMGKSGNASISEQNLLDIIKTVYFKAEKLRIRKKDLIPDKPHIQGFDLDIYVPELRKGIEFDGNYWHSIHGLKRGRANWPKEDLVNYHKIKDEYFLKNHKIQILHIDEKNWINDQKKCIETCFKFLNIKKKESNDRI